MKMKIPLLLTMVSIVSLLTLVGTASAQKNILPQYIADSNTQDNGCPENSDADFCFDENDDINDGIDEGFHTDDDDECFGSDADFCGGADYIPNDRKNNDNDNDNDKGIYACNVITDTDEFCKKNLEKNIQKQEDNNKQSSDKGKITVGYGSVGSYYGKGKVVITNEDTGETLVEKKLNFAKQHHNQGPDCCVKVYKFDKDEVDRGDDISVKVTAGNGSWDTAPYDYKKNLRISITLDEIGE